MQIDIISDTVCPWCLVGKRHLEQALAQRPDLEVNINWLPFQLNPDVPAEGLDRQQAIAAKFGSAARAKEIYERVSQAGKAAGIQFNFDAIPKTPNTINAHRLIHWAGLAGVQDQMVEILFRQFFMDGLDIGDPEILIKAAGEAGLDVQEIATKLDSDADTEQVKADERRARTLGVQGVPFFVFDNKYALSGAQPPEAFLQVFEQLQNPAEEKTNLASA